MAEQRVVAAGENCGHPSSANGEQWVADGVRAAEDAMQPPGPQTMADRSLPQTHRHELPPRDDAMLAGRKRSDRSIAATRLGSIAVTFRRFWTHVSRKLRQVASGGTSAGQTPRVARGV
jgi:hypothetical protein